MQMLLSVLWLIQGWEMKRSPEMGETAIQPLIAQIAGLIHIQVTFHFLTL